MMCYKDKCYCKRSSEHWCEQEHYKYCDNKQCYRHASEIPDNLPEYLPICWSDFGEQCEDYK